MSIYRRGTKGGINSNTYIFQCECGVDFLRIEYIKDIDLVEFCMLQRASYNKKLSLFKRLKILFTGKVYSDQFIFNKKDFDKFIEILNKIKKEQSN